MNFAAGEGGWIAIAGLGPGDEALVTPEVDAALAAATDVVGYIPYVARVAPRAGLVLHPSDNRVELDRAAHALDLAAQGRRVVVVSSGDPGVFAMASALFEALEAGPAHWRDIDIRVLPGITAMLAAAARAGAPLGRPQHQVQRDEDAADHRDQHRNRVANALHQLLRLGAAIPCAGSDLGD